MELCQVFYKSEVYNYSFMAEYITLIISLLYFVFIFHAKKITMYVILHFICCFG